MMMDAVNQLVHRLGGARTDPLISGHRKLYPSCLLPTQAQSAPVTLFGLESASFGIEAINRSLTSGPPRYARRAKQ
jgi:hypothetical protein